MEKIDKLSSIINEVDSLRRELKETEGKVGLIRDRLTVVYDELEILKKDVVFCN